MMGRVPFNPYYTQGQVVTPGAASAQITISAVAKQVCLTNSGVNICYVRIGTGTFSATTADMPVLPNSQVILTKGDGNDKVAHISAAGTTLQVLPGEGW